MMGIRSLCMAVSLSYIESLHTWMDERGRAELHGEKKGNKNNSIITPENSFCLVICIVVL